MEIVDVGNCRGQAIVMTDVITKTEDSTRTISLNPMMWRQFRSKVPTNIVAF